MKSIHEIIKIMTEHKKELKEKYKIKEIKVFGSYARGEQKETSDMDLIVDFEETPTLIELLRLEEEIEKILGIKVDLLTEECISPFIKPYVKEVVAI